jgi:hypothetical protein
MLSAILRDNSRLSGHGQGGDQHVVYRVIIPPDLRSNWSADKAISGVKRAGLFV